MKALRAFLVRPASERGLAGFVLYRIRWSINTLIVLVIVSSAGYVILEHFSILGGIYMTVITLSTVGYNEVHPLDSVGRVFTIGVIAAGFATLAYTGAVLTALITSGEISDHLRKSRNTRMRHAITDHVIVVGFGRVGQAVAHGVAELGRPCVVIDRSPERAELITEAGFVPMTGDATAEADLVDAGIERAVALVAAAEADAVNLIVTLTARALRPDLRIISRVNEETWKERIVRAGASVAQSPYRSYGLSLAASAIHPSVVEMHAVPELGLVTEEIAVPFGSPLVGRRLGDLSSSSSGVLVLGVRRDKRIHRWNEVDGEVAVDDVLIVLGPPDATETVAFEG